MQTLKLLIPGTYYDSQIYSGRLYLWSNDGSIITIDWDKLIDGIKIPDSLKFALVCAFQKSEYLYGDKWKLLFQDKEIMSVIQSKFEKLAVEPIEISKAYLKEFIIREQDNPLSFPHADSTIYNNTMYIGSQSGVLAATCNARNKNPISTRPKTLWDGPSLSVTASYQTLAIAAGNDGLFEYALSSDYDIYSRRRQPHRLMEQHSNSARWLYASIYSSSYFNEGYLADFTLEDNRNYEENRKQRVLRDIVPSSKIFEHQTKNGISSFSWGLHDKICFATPKSVEIAQYSPYKDQNERYLRLGIVKTKELEGDIVNGDSALFGFVIESDDGILVINSLMETMWLSGEPVNWRVFPKSKFYTNQLHIIYDNHLCIHSFNQDYFIDQDTKKVGIRRPKEFPFRR